MSLLDVAAVIFIIAVLIIVFLTAFPKVVLFFIMLFYATFGTEEDVRRALGPYAFGGY
jgi:hypothetical protein